VSEADGDPLFAGFAMLASALAGRPLAVAPGKAGDPAWTDGQSIFIDPGASRRAVLESVAVQASLMAAGSFDVQVLKRLSRRSKLVQRYLAIEGHRALLENDDLLPETLRTLADRELASRTDSPQSSVTLAEAKHALAPSPENFGTIRIKKLIAANRRASTEAESEEAQHVPRRTSSDELEEFDDDQIDDSGHPDPFSSPVGGGGLIGKWLKKLLSSARKSGDGGGPPGADAPTSRTNSAKRGAVAGPMTSMRPRTNSRSASARSQVRFASDGGGLSDDPIASSPYTARIILILSAANQNERPSAMRPTRFPAASAAKNEGDSSALRAASASVMTPSCSSVSCSSSALLARGQAS